MDDGMSGALDQLIEARRSQEYAMAGHGLDCLGPDSREMGEAMLEADIALTERAAAELAALRRERDGLMTVVNLYIDDHGRQEAESSGITRGCNCSTCRKARMACEQRAGKGEK